MRIAFSLPGRVQLYPFGTTVDENCYVQPFFLSLCSGLNVCVGGQYLYVEILTPVVMVPGAGHLGGDLVMRMKPS